MFWQKLGKLVLYALAAFGVCCAIGIALLTGLLKDNFITEEEEVIPAPNGELSAVREVTRGGFGTVWTNKIYVEDENSNRRMVYRNKDSDYEPPMTWTDDETLEITVHCGRVNHMSSPAGWMEGKNAFERFRVRFIYDEKMCASPEGDE